MTKLRLDKKTLAAGLDRSLEHVRKLISGLAPPGRDLQPRLAEVLELELRLIEDAVESDQWFKKHGKKPPSSEGFVSPLEKLWVQLTPEQRDQLVCVAECMFKRNKKEGGASIR